MKSQRVIVYGICVLIMSALLGACTASGELGDDDQDRSAAIAPDTAAALVPPAVKPAAPVQTSKQGFTTKEDTIEVESAQRNHRSEHTAITVPPRTPAVAPARSGFAVQIGAFKNEANASRARDLFARRSKRPVVQQFDESLHLYRIVAGEFATAREAWRFAATLKKKYPREYAHAWVVRISE